MRILNEGNKKAALWWAGKTLSCQVCDRSIELEESDATSPSVRLPNVHQLVYACETCSNEIIIDNNAELITETIRPSNNNPPPPTQPNSKTLSTAAPVGPVTVTASKPTGAAPVGNTVTTNSWSNPFKGTNWGI